MRDRIREVVSIEAQIVPTCGNVFADLGFVPAEAQVMTMRADLMIALERAIKLPVETTRRATASDSVSRR